jgi:hypothetical protein
MSIAVLLAEIASAAVSIVSVVHRTAAIPKPTVNDGAAVFHIAASLHPVANRSPEIIIPTISPPHNPSRDLRRYAAPLALLVGVKIHASSRPALAQVSHHFVHKLNLHFEIPR